MVAAVIHGPDDRLLIAKRPDDVHQGGFWEFPGGKVEPGESEIHALKRELFEELGVKVRAATPLIRIQHDYPDKSVHLSTWRVQAFEGRPEGMEGQLIEWCPASELASREFPAANDPILKAALLPDRYLITPPDIPSPDALARVAGRAVEQGARLFQLRLHTNDHGLITAMADTLMEVASPAGAEVLINASLEMVRRLGWARIHLPWREAEKIDRADLVGLDRVAVSCHNVHELAHAARLGVDFALLSPVRWTQSHPNTPILGWSQFAAMANAATIPVYALGGLRSSDLPVAKLAGAQGIAGISGLWPLDQ